MRIYSHIVVQTEKKIQELLDKAEQYDKTLGISQTVSTEYKDVQEKPAAEEDKQPTKKASEDLQKLEKGGKGSKKVQKKQSKNVKVIEEEKVKTIDRRLAAINLLVTDETKAIQHYFMKPISHNVLRKLVKSGMHYNEEVKRIEDEQKMKEKKLKEEEEK